MIKIPENLFSKETSLLGLQLVVISLCSRLTFSLATWSNRDALLLFLFLQGHQSYMTRVFYDKGLTLKTSLIFN